MLFGRDAEREQLEQLLDAVASGPVGCIVEGAPGIGKTALWREFVEGAGRRGYLVLDAAPSEPDSALAFSGLSDLFGRLPGDALETLPEVQAHALRAALLLGEVPEGSRGAQALPRAVLGVLRQLSASGPIVVTIDDEQWLDPSSARVLAFALCRLRDEPVVVVVARRSDQAGVLSVELGRRFVGRGLEAVSLQALPISTIKTLLEARLNRSISRPVLRRIHETAGGNPLYALAIALELEARHAHGDRAGDLPVPRTLSEAIELRLGRLDPRASEAMLSIAALSQPTLAMLQAAIPEFALSDLESAERAGVIEITGDRVGFTHPLLASTHYAMTPASKRRELHRRLARVVQDEEERAQHIALGAEAPDREIADILEQAAGAAARRGAAESAAQLLQDAARLTPMDQEIARSARIVAAAEHRFTAGEVARARTMLESVIPDLDSGPLRARAKIQLSAIRSDEPKLAIELLEAALADAGGDDRLRVEIYMELAAVLPDIGRFALARDHAELALSAAERFGDPELLGIALGGLLATFVCTGDRLRQDVLARLSSLEDSAATSTYLQPSTQTGLALYYAGETEAARPLLERAAQLALTRGEEWVRLGTLLTLARLEWDSGNQRLSKERRQVAEEVLGEYEEFLPWIFVMDARCALDRGDLTAARANAEQGLALAERKASLLNQDRLINCLAVVELRSGRPDQAHVRLAHLRAQLATNGWGPAGANWAELWSLDVEALVAMARLEEADAVLAELRSRAEISESRHVRALTSRSEGLLLAARGELDAAIAAMDRALAAHQLFPRPYEHGRTLVEKGSLERRARHKAAAKQTLDQALAILEPLGAEIWVARARDELSRIGIRRAKATEGLTAAQTRVAELVVTGLTNHQIAEQLHMSQRTVESHLSQVYREYRVSSRSQLVAALAGAHYGPAAAASAAP